MVSNNNIPNLIINNHISVKTAESLSGYSTQYIRRLLRMNRITGLKIGQVWLIEIESLKDYLNLALKSEDQRFSPR